MQDPTKPLFHWYVDGIAGKELVIALYTRPCRYGRCTFCSLPSLAEGGGRVTPAHLEQQVDFVLSQRTPEELDQVAKLSIYTASSSLDQATLPTRSLMYLVLKVCDLPKLAMISLETRPEYVEEWELKALHHILGPTVELEVGIGYETHDPVLRNKILKKGLTEQNLVRLMGKLSSNGCSLKAYLMLKPHWSLTEQGAIHEAIAGLDHLKKLGQDHGVPVSIHLNPTYMAEECDLTDEMVAHGYQPPELASVLEVVRAAAHRALPIYVGLDDEGLAIEGGTFESSGIDKVRTVKALLQFNRHQDVERLMEEVRQGA